MRTHAIGLGSIVCGSVLALTSAGGCGGAITLGVDPTQPTPVESLPAPPLGQRVYKKILLLPPSDPVAVRDVEYDVPRDTKATYYVGKLEKLLLAQGFEVISSEIVARAGETGGTDKRSPAEKAMVLGRQTKADAVLMLQSVTVRGLARYFDADEAQSIEVEESRVTSDEDGYYDRESERCLHRLPYYEVQVEAKLLDAQTGAVLWVGSGRGSSIDVIQDRWVAEVDDDCEILDQNFVYDDYQRDETTFDNAVTSLLKRLVAPFAKVALAGTEVEREPVPVAPAPPPPPPPVETPAVKTALVSSAGAALRDGPTRKSAKKMVVPRKAKVEVLESMGEWTKVKVQDGTVGWMHESTIIMPE
jgi:hypothetical protein